MLTPQEYASSNTEHSHQVAVFMWASIAKQILSQLEWMHAIPNGGLRDKIVAGRLKAEGVKEGVSDIFLPWPMMNLEGTALEKCGLYIEMKRITSKANKTGIDRAKGVQSKKQVEFRTYAIEHYYTAYVCYGWEQAVFAICYYLRVDFLSINAFVEEEYRKVKNGK